MDSSQCFSAAPTLQDSHHPTFCTASSLPHSACSYSSSGSPLTLISAPSNLLSTSPTLLEQLRSTACSLHTQAATPSKRPSSLFSIETSKWPGYPLSA